MQKALGHSDLSTTMIYTHIAQEELEADMKGLYIEDLYMKGLYMKGL